jgi:hypothetical protein
LLPAVLLAALIVRNSVGVRFMDDWVLGLLSSSAATGALLAVLFALVALYWVIHIRDEGLRGRLIPWLSVGGYALLSGVATALGRSQFGLQQALSNRYIPSSLYLCLAVGLAAQIVLQHARANGSLDRREWRVARAFLGGGLASFLALHTTSASIGMAELAREGRMLRYGKACLSLVLVHPDERCLSDWVYPSTTPLPPRGHGPRRAGVHPTAADQEPSLAGDPADRSRASSGRRLRAAVREAWALRRESRTETGRRWASRPSPCLARTWREGEGGPTTALAGEAT